MKKNDPFQESAQADDDKAPPGLLALIVFAIGALSGAVISQVIARTNRLKAALHPEQPVLGVVDNCPDGPPLAGGEAAEIPATQLSTYLGGNTPAIPPSPDSPTTATTPTPATSKTGKQVPAASNAVKSYDQKRWSIPTRYIMGVFLFMAALAVLFIGRATIPMVVAAMLLAVIVDPIIKFFARRLKYNLSVGLTYILVVAVLLAIPLLMVPPLVNAINFVSEIDFPLLAQSTIQAMQNISTTIQAYPALAGILSPTLETLIGMLNNFASQTQASFPAFSLSFEQLTSNFGKALGTANKILGPTFSVLASLFITLLMSLQMTLTSSDMKDWYADLIPPGYEGELTDLIGSIRGSWTGFLRGQVLLMFVIGTVTWLGGSVLGLPQALLLGVIAGLLELIPSIGPILAAIPAVLLALLFGSVNFDINHLVFALIVVAFYALVQLLENQILVPRIMGDAVDLPPLVVLIGTIAGAGAFGILGALLATPVIATGNLVFRYVYGKIIEAPPTPPPVEEKSGILESLRGFISRLRKRK